MNNSGSRNLMANSIAESPDDPVLDDAESKDFIHPLAEVINRFLHSTHEIRFAARNFIPAAGAYMNKQAEGLKSDFNHADELMRSADPGNKAHGLKLAFGAIRQSQRLRYSQLTRQLESSLFVGLFSSFDVFTGELLIELYKKKPVLFDGIKRDIPLSVVLSVESIDELKASILDEEIEAFRRKSYADQFEYLESLFGVSLRKFSKWPNFIEAAQRRNLLTHCDGVVSEQYRKVCQKEGCPISELPKVGEKLNLGAQYFLSVCDLMYEVGLKLGHTLWRKVLPDDIEKADVHLNDVVYDALSLEQWSLAEIGGEFFVKQKNFHSELTKKMAVINYSISLKNLGKISEMSSVLGSFDWTASIPEFRLGTAVLMGRTDEALNLMRSIGKNGQILKEHSYHTWPLFGEFRDSLDFQKCYEEIYGYQFVSKVRSASKEEFDALAHENNEPGD